MRRFVNLKRVKHIALPVIAFFGFMIALIVIPKLDSFLVINIEKDQMTIVDQRQWGVPRDVEIFISHGKYLLDIYEGQTTPKALLNIKLDKDIPKEYRIKLKDPLTRNLGFAMLLILFFMPLWIRKDVEEEQG